MAKRAATTIVLIRSDAIARADFSAASKPALLSLNSQSRPSAAPIPALIEAALMLDAAPIGRRVWVLCEDLWTQALSLAAAAIAGIDEIQLARALSFEAEPLSGIAAFDAAIAFHSLPARTHSNKSFWVTALEKRVLNDIQVAIQKRGGKLSGVAHPGGLPRSLANPNASVWRRIEFWDKTTLCVSDGQVNLIGANFMQERVRSSVAEWLRGGNTGSLEVLQSQAVDLPRELAGDVATMTLHSRESLSQWLEEWASHLTSSGGSKVPLHYAAVASNAGRWRIGAALLAQAAVLALCVFHLKYVRNATQETKDAIQRHRQPIQQLADLKKQIEQTEKDLKSLRTQNRALETEQISAELELACRKKRISVFLQRLAAERPEDLVIQSISAENDATLSLKGLSLEAGLSDELARRLTVALAVDGWEVRPGNKQAQQILENGGPWQFTLMLKPIAPPTNSKNMRPTDSRAEVIDQDIELTAALGKEKQR